MGNQYQKTNAVTVVLTATASAKRFIGLDGAPATSAGGAHDSCGVSETEGGIGEAISVITGYSASVEAGADIAQFDFVKPAADGSGKAIVGSEAEHCGRALEAATTGQVFECQVLNHAHA
jgi:hypothetical protein